MRVLCQIRPQLAQGRVERWDREMEDVAAPFDVDHLGEVESGLGLGLVMILERIKDILAAGMDEREGRTEDQHEAESDRMERRQLESLTLVI